MRFGVLDSFVCESSYIHPMMVLVSYVSRVTGMVRGSDPRSFTCGGCSSWRGPFSFSLGLILF